MPEPPPSCAIISRASWSMRRFYSISARQAYRRITDKCRASRPPSSGASRGLIDLSDARASRIEFRCPDALCNPYLAFAAMLMAGIDGFENRLYNLDPSEPIEKFYRLQSHELIKMRLIPGRLDDLTGPFEAAPAFLFKGDVFTQDVIAAQCRASAVD